jgi:hypothetical protein
MVTVTVTVTVTIYIVTLFYVQLLPVSSSFFAHVTVSISKNNLQHRRIPIGTLTHALRKTASRTLSRKGVWIIDLREPIR